MAFINNPQSSANILPYLLIRGTKPKNGKTKETIISNIRKGALDGHLCLYLYLYLYVAYYVFKNHANTRTQHTVKKKDTAKIKNEKKNTHKKTDI